MTAEACVEVPFEVQKPQAGLRVDRFLAERLHRYSRAEVQRLIRQGRVSLNGGAAAKAARTVRDGDVVRIRYPRREDAPPRRERLDVLYEDARLLAVDKPAGMLSHPTDKALRNCVTSVLKLQFPGLSLHLAHRLDRETSGVLLLAKDPEAARLLTERFTRRELRKEYLAIAAGRLPFRRKRVDLPLSREGGEIKVRQAVAAEGARAETDFRRLDANDGFSLVQAVPRTGRLHQIRVHLAALGHPVLGDKLYTGAGEFYLKACRRVLGPQDEFSLGAGRQMLHAWRLTLLHPATGRRLALAAPIPEDFRAGLRKAGLRFDD